MLKKFSFKKLIEEIEEETAKGDENASTDYVAFHEGEQC